MVRCEHRWSSAKVIEALADLMVMKATSISVHLICDS
jgi:hypothetical protein